MEIIEKYYLDLEKNKDLIEKQKEREQKLINFANESRDLSIEELFYKIRDFIGLEYADMYAEEPDYKEKFKEIFAYTKKREMNNNECQKLGQFLLHCLKQKYGEELTEDQIDESTYQRAIIINDRD